MSALHVSTTCSAEVISENSASVKVNSFSSAHSIGTGVGLNSAHLAPGSNTDNCLRIGAEEDAGWRREFQIAVNICEGRRVNSCHEWIF